MTMKTAEYRLTAVVLRYTMSVSTSSASIIRKKDPSLQLRMTGQDATSASNA
jgi:hypothetical protein